jgi:hypothetical protein
MGQEIRAEMRFTGIADGRFDFRGHATECHSVPWPPAGVNLTAFDREVPDNLLFWRPGNEHVAHDQATVRVQMAIQAGHPSHPQPADWNPEQLQPRADSPTGFISSEGVL